MAKIENFFEMTEEQRLSIYNKIEMNQLDKIDLEDTLKEINREQYNQLRAEVENNESYFKIFKANVDAEKQVKFIKENQSEQEKSTKDREDITEEERNRNSK